MADVTSTAAATDSIESVSSTLASALPSITSSATAAVSSAVASAASSVVVSGFGYEGVYTTLTVPYLDPYSTLSPPIVTPAFTRKYGDHEYDLWTLTNNPFLTSTKQCFIGSCSLILSYTHYFPAAGPTLFLIAFFGLAFLYHLGLGISRKTWGYMVGMVVGSGLEIAGYVGRYRQRTNPWLQTNFLLNIICLTIGPAFITASIYLCLARIIMAYGSGNARFKPQIYTVTFMVGDFISLVLQGAGGGIASTSDPDTSAQKGGINTMIAGLVFQVVSLLFFIILSLDFATCVVRGKAGRNPSFERLTSSFKWKGFLAALAVATITIFIRCCYRVAELSKGFQSDFAQEEVTFSVLESAMIGIAVLALSLAHPGFIFGRSWEEANFSVRGRKLPNSSSSSDTSMSRAKKGRVGMREV